MGPQPSRSSPPGSSAGHRLLRERLLSGGAYSFVAIVIAQGIALITSVLYARLLGPENLGVLAIFSQIASVAVAFGGLGLGTSITKFVAQLRASDRPGLERVLSTALVVVLTSSGGASVALFLLAEPLASLYGSPDLSLMLRLSSLFLTLNALSAVGSAVLQGLQAIRRLSILGIAIEAASVPVIFVSVSTLGLVGAAVAGVILIVLASAMIFGSAWHFLRREGVRSRLTFDRRSLRALLGFTVPLLISLVVLRLSALVQTSFLAMSLGYVETGLFKIASTLHHVVLFVPGAMSIPLLPAMSELYASVSASRARESLTTLLRLTSYAGVLVALAVGFSAVPLISILYGTEYLGASTLVFILVIAGYSEMISTVAATSALGEGRTWLILSVDLVQSVVIVGGTVVFVTWFGLVGIGLAVLLNSIVYGIGILALLARSNRVDLRRTMPALTDAIVAFLVAVAAFLWGNAQANLWLGAVVVMLIAAAFWARLERREKDIAKGAVQMLRQRIGR